MSHHSGSHHRHAYRQHHGDQHEAHYGQHDGYEAQAHDTHGHESAQAYDAQGGYAYPAADEAAYAHAYDQARYDAYARQHAQQQHDEQYQQGYGYADEHRAAPSPNRGHHQAHQQHAQHPARAKAQQHAHAKTAKAAHKAKPHAKAGASDHDYTFGHGRRQVRVGPIAFWICVCTLVIMAGWSGMTAIYFTFRDDVLTRLITRQAQMQFAYEDRISDLRAQVDRTTSRQLLDQEQFEQKLQDILRRQAALEARANALNTLPDMGATGSIRQPGKTSSFEGEAAPKQAAITDTAIFIAPPDREARLEGRAPVLASSTDSGMSLASMGGSVNKLYNSLDRIEKKQVLALTAAEEGIEQSLRRMRGVFADLNLDYGRVQNNVPRTGMGGPYLPVKPRGNASDFERQLYRIQLSRSQADSMRRTLLYVPYRVPVLGTPDISSGFGVRSDPFYGRPAMHSGQDFRGDSGDPVRATAAGKVITANWSGGYGRLIEIDHGNDLTTRYGHLSAFKVKVGDVVQAGQIIGEIGSTGRSTGPHLHYETRIDGEAVNPQKFLRAGVRMAAP